MRRWIWLGLIVMMGCSDGGDSNNSSNNNRPDMSDAGDMAEDADMPPEVVGATYRFAPESDDFFATPYPSDVRKKSDGTMGFTDFPGLIDNRIGGRWLEGADDLKTGWGLTSALYTFWDTELDATTLPSLDESVADAWPSVFLMNVEADSAKFGERLPIDCKFVVPVGTFHPGNQLACTSPYGVLRDANTVYALVFTSGLKDLEGRSVVMPSKLKSLLNGQPIAGKNGEVAAQPYIDAKDAILAAGLPEADLRGFSLFTTYDPVSRFLKVSEFYAQLPEPTLSTTQPPTVIEEYDDYIVLEAYYDVPNIQEGTIPYSTPPDGRIVFGDNGMPEIQGWETIKVFITLPKMPMPDGGFPLLIYMHGSGGSATELMNRGSKTMADQVPPPGTGPASVIAPYGIAGFSADFAFHDSRLPNNPDTSGLKLYNILENPRAMVDNFAVASNEVALHARLMASLTIDPSISTFLDAGGAADGMIRFNDDRFAAMGQSMGSMIGTPTMTIPGHIDAFINSGSGGTLIEIALETRDPVYLKPILKTIFRLRGDEDFDRYDIALNTLQHMFDHMDPTLHARHVILEPHPNTPARHVFHPSGLEDRYFSPAARAGLSTALGVPLVEPVLQPEAFEWMKWVGNGAAIQTPVQANMPGGITGFVRQFEPAYSEAGHYVMFDKPEARAQYACFIKSLSADAAPVLRSPENSTVENCP